MEPWGMPTLTRYSCEDFPSRTTGSHLLLRKDEIRPNVWPEILWLKFVKKTSMQNPVASLGYMKCCSSSSPRPVKSPSNSIRHNHQIICSWLRGPKTILEIRKKATFMLVINKPVIYKFFKDFTNHRKKSSRAVVFSCRPFPDILKIKDYGWDLPTIWKTRILLTHIEEFS